jgi:hypothetical protein
MENAFSKWLAIAMLAASSVWCRAADGNDPVVVRYHFAGTVKLTDANYDEIKKILHLPSSVEYRELVLNRFAAKIAAGISGNKSGALVRPLLDDLLANESAGVFGVPGQQPQSFVVAVHLPADRAAAWKQNLGQSSDNMNGLHVRNEGEWLIVARGSALKTAEDKFATDIRKNHRPVAALSGTILEANIDWPRLSNLPVIAALPLKPAVLQLKVSPKGSHLRTEIHAHYAEPIAWKSQEWHLPTETIRDPLVSFTAGQNAAAFMKPQQWTGRIGENPLTNQFFIWSDLNLPFETSALFPRKDAARHVQLLGRKWPSDFNAELKQHDLGKLKYLAQTNEILWQGLPIITPFLTSIKEKSGEFLLAGTFVFVSGGPPAPADLWAQFKRSDLVYYDWEFSGPRLAQWRMIEPLLPYFPTARTNYDTSAQSAKNAKAPHTPTTIVENWVTALIPALSPSKEASANGNVVTEITRSSSTDYTIVRSSQLGFTGFELLILSHGLAGVPLPELPKPPGMPGQ